MSDKYRLLYEKDTQTDEKEVMAVSIEVIDRARLEEMVVMRGVSKAEFAKELGMSPAFMSQVCTGKSSLSPRTAKLIADRLDVQWGELFRIKQRGGDLH